jgi:hypothetical protein
MCAILALSHNECILLYIKDVEVEQGRWREEEDDKGEGKKKEKRHSKELKEGE